MAGNNKNKGSAFSIDDPLDINELASLNDDITPEFIEQLQNQVAQNASQFIGKSIESKNDDAELFEEIPSSEEEIKENAQEESQEKTQESEEPAKPVFDANIDDNFINKYKAKLNKSDEKVQSEEETKNKNNKTETIEEPKQKEKSVVPQTSTPKEFSGEEIKNLTSGNIIEKPAQQEQIDYNESLDYLDDNIKYTKYVIYVDPENVDFIESLTVKERKNLVNKILKEQSDITLTKRRLGVMQEVIKHIIIAIMTISIAIPVVYWTINTSLEASINNYRRSQTVFQTLYREKGKIKPQK